MRLAHPLRHVPHTVRGPIGSFTASGTHNALLTTADGRVLRQDIFLTILEHSACSGTCPT
eukprot:6482553-Pyramimonas_sp.AAC.1